MRIQLCDGARLKDPTGYGQIARGLYKALTELGHTVGHSLVPIEAEVDIYTSPPYGFTDLRDTFNVAITMTERETVAGYKDRFDWAGLCNQMDLIITPSQWNKEVFEREGITKPIEVLPMGIDHGFWKPKTYRFLSVIDGLGRYGSRWNWKQLAKAYFAAFTDEDVEWTIKSREGKKVDFKMDKPKITVIEDILSEEEMLALYQASDCYLDYSREGWGYTIWQAISCGLNVIAPNYGVQKEYLTEAPKVILFDGGHLSEDNLKFEGGNLKMLTKSMQKFYQESRLGSQFAQNFGWKEVSRRLVELIHTKQTGGS